MKTQPKRAASDSPSRLITFAVGLFILVITSAHLFTPPAYSLTGNTVSELAAQSYAGAWLMRLGLVVFGLAVVTAMILRIKATNRYLMPDVAMGIYGLGIFLSGVFSTAPFESAIPFSETEASIHSFFATLAGIFISLAIISYVFADDVMKRRLTHAVFATAVIGLSALFGLADSGAADIGKGLIQKTMFLVGLSWIVLNCGRLNTTSGLL